MTRRIATIVATVALILSPAAAYADDAVQQIRALEAQFAGAVNAKNVDAIMR